MMRGMREGQRDMREGQRGISEGHERGAEGHDEGHERGAEEGMMNTAEVKGGRRLMIVISVSSGQEAS
jgi:hypothetical protein